MSKFPFHTVLFGIFPIVFIYSHNVREIPLSDLFSPILIVFISILIILIIAKLLFKNIIKIEIIFSIFLILFFSYGHIHELVRKINLLSFMHEDHLYLMMCWCQILGISTLYILTTKNNLKNGRIIFNKISFFLITFSLINIFVFFGQTLLYSPKETIKQLEKIDGKLFFQTNFKPDIYYIILDRYGNEEALSIFAKYDNSDFIKWLENKDFVVALKSKSNYLKTAQSLASSLNLKYINYLNTELGDKSDNLLPLYSLIKENELYKIMRNNGYKIIHSGSWWETTRRNENADINFTINYYGFSEFMNMICEKSWLNYFFEVNSHSRRRILWGRIISQLNELSEIPKIKDPTFTFAHLIIPHNPFVFDRIGNYKSINEESKNSYEENYIDQLIYINDQLKKLIDTLISKSKHPPIIILQADEGPFPYNYRLNEKDFNWKNATKLELKQKMGILNAFYLPNIENKIIYENITPVNTFRLVFNCYFNTNYDMLPDKSYAHYSEKFPYRFFDVTATLNHN
jgi:hypothetical protein